MKIQVRDLTGSGLLLLVVTGVGCAHRLPTPTAAPESFPKPDVGIVGVVAAPAPATSDLQRPGLVGAGAGAKHGAGVGGGVFITLAAESVLAGRAGPIAALMVAAASIALAPVGAAVGAVAGAIAAPSPVEVERSAAAIERALADANLVEAVPAWIVAAAGTRPIVVNEGTGGGAIDTRLELEPPYITLRGGEWKDWSPQLTLRVHLRGRLVRLVDAEELRTFSWDHDGPKATLVKWGEADARRFREALEQAGRALTAKIVDDLY